jgi:hypothetical protein
MASTADINVCGFHGVKCSDSGIMGCENAQSCRWTPKSWVPDHIIREAVRDCTPPYHHEQEDGLYTLKEQNEAHSTKQFLPSF